MKEVTQQFDWQQLPNMPVAKWEPASLLIDGLLYVLGGYENYIMSSIISHLPSLPQWGYETHVQFKLNLAICCAKNC